MMETVLGRIPESMAASASENARNYFMHRHVLSLAVAAMCNTLRPLGTIPGL